MEDVWEHRKPKMLERIWHTAPRHRDYGKRVEIDSLPREKVAALGRESPLNPIGLMRRERCDGRKLIVEERDDAIAQVVGKQAHAPPSPLTGRFGNMKVPYAAGVAFQNFAHVARESATDFCRKAWRGVREARRSEPV